MHTHSSDTAMTSRLRSLLLDLARRQEDLAADELAADELAATPYWSPCPPTVLGYRSAATALRAEAETLLTAS
jgi:hypothetical protein